MHNTVTSIRNEMKEVLHSTTLFELATGIGKKDFMLMR
jgi:Rrf2 family iron-sulfur cluster assembly transcriptional regulator